MELKALKTIKESKKKKVFLFCSSIQCSSFGDWTQEMAAEIPLLTPYKMGKFDLSHRFVTHLIRFIIQYTNNALLWFLNYFSLIHYENN